MRIALILAAALGSVLFTGGWLAVTRESKFNQCTYAERTPDRATGARIDFTLVPPGYDCVYTDRNGREVARKRAP